MENLLNENIGILEAFTNLERLNFVHWYSTATPEDLELARKNNAEKLDKMIEKYKYDFELSVLMYGQ
ncbi:MAG: hypothetical protein NG747_13215 [Candidatus Brocadia sp.]|nr:hypothetical protein [Candidatus Brocadia sp.]